MIKCTERSFTIQALASDNTSYKPVLSASEKKLKTLCDNIVANKNNSVKVAELLEEFSGKKIESQDQVKELVTDIVRQCKQAMLKNSIQAFGFRIRNIAEIKDEAQRFAEADKFLNNLQEEFEKAFVALGGTVVSKQTYSEGDQDFSAQLTAIRSSGPDVSFIPGHYTEVGNIAVQAKKLGVNTPLLGGDGSDSSKLGEIGGESLNGCFYSNHYSHQDPSERVQDFIKRYREKFKSDPDSLAALAYDSARVTIEAMKRAPDLSGPALRAAIAETKEFPGVAGVITLDANRNPVKPAVVLKIEGGKFKYVDTVSP